MSGASAGGATLAVDAGTSVIKAVVIGETGRELAVATQPAVVHVSGVRSEQNPAAVLQAVLDCIAQAAAASGEPVARLALTAQGDGAWFVDADAEPVGRAVLWNDGRAAQVVRGWTADGVLDAAFRINGSQGNAGLPHAILRWSTEHDAERLAAADRVLTCGGWLFLGLTGTLGLHPSDASAPWLDVRSGGVSPHLLRLFGLQDLAHLVPPVLQSEELTAPLLPAVARSVGLPDGTPLTMAPYDVVATAHGSGAVERSDGFCILGTTVCTGVLVDEPDTDGTPTGLTLLGRQGEPVTRAFPTLAGAGVVDWAVDLLGLTAAAQLSALAEQSAPGANGARVLPYLSPAGERVPFLDADARGTIGGLSFSTGRADIARAVLEGLAHLVRDCLDAAPSRPRVLTLAGGGAASDVWCQSIADVTGLPTERTLGAQLGARGATLAALVADGQFPSVPEAARALPATRDRFEPVEARRSLFDDRHADFLATREALRPRWHAWQGHPDA